MGFLDFIGDVVSSTVDIASNVASGAAVVTSNVVDVVVENPGKTLLAVGATSCYWGTCNGCCPSFSCSSRRGWIAWSSPHMNCN